MSNILTSVVIESLIISLVAMEGDDFQAQVYIAANADSAEPKLVEGPVIFDAQRISSREVWELDRVLYVQTWNSEVPLTDVQRAVIRSILSERNKNHAFFTDHDHRYETVAGDIYGGVTIKRNSYGNDTTLQLHAGITDQDVKTTLTFDLSNGPVPFTQRTLEDADFMITMEKIATYAFTKADRGDFTLNA